MHKIFDARSALTVALAFALFLAGAGPASASERRKLRQPAEFDGVLCTRYAWVNEDGSLDSCFLAEDTVLNGQELPAGTKVDFDEDGNPGCVFLPGDTEIEGHLLRGHGHDYQTCFHPNGRLRFGSLADREEIQGIPCQRATFFTWIFSGDASVRFHENGALKNCLVAEEFEYRGETFKRRKRIELDPDGWVVKKSKTDR